MCSWRRVAVARVFALVVRCRVRLLLLYSRVGKNRDTEGRRRREPGRAVPLTTKRSSLARRFSRYGEPIAYTDLLGTGHFILSQSDPQVYPKPLNAFYNQTTL